mgnify:CR=1 FL=1
MQASQINSRISSAKQVDQPIKVKLTSTVLPSSNPLVTNDRVGFVQMTRSTGEVGGASTTGQLLNDPTENLSGFAWRTTAGGVDQLIYWRTTAAVSTN